MDGCLEGTRLGLGVRRRDVSVVSDLWAAVYFLLLTSYLLVLEGREDHRGAAGGGDAGEDEADGVGDHLEEASPPGVVGFAACLEGFVGVSQDGVALGFGQFYFHGVRV